MKKSLQLREKRKKLHTKFVKVTDDWFPSIEGYCRVTYGKNHISAWGDDDFGVELVGEKATEDLFEYIVSQEEVNVVFFKNLGFEPA